MSDFLPEYFAVLALALFSFSDLRYRLAPGIEFFFLAALAIAAPGSLFNICLVVLAFSWGWIKAMPGVLVLPVLLCPPAWPVLLAGFGVRQGLVGRADLLAIAALACLFPWTGLALALLGLEAWRRLWRRRQPGPVPAIPGLLLGSLAYLLARLFLHIA